MPQNNTIDKPVKDIDAVGNAVEDINATNHAVEDIDAVDKAVKEADAWALARNPVYRNMQQKLIERTAERDVMRAAYLELVRTIGSDIFDDVPDRFNIRGLITQEEQIHEKLNNI